MPDGAEVVSKLVVRRARVPGPLVTSRVVHEVVVEVQVCAPLEAAGVRGRVLLRSQVRSISGGALLGFELGRGAWPVQPLVTDLAFRVHPRLLPDAPAVSSADPTYADYHHSAARA